MAVDFTYPADGAAGELAAKDAGRVRRETLFRLLHFLALKAKPKDIGQRVLVLAFLAGATAYGKQKQLAARMRVSPSRASRIVNSVRCEFSKLAKGN